MTKMFVLCLCALLAACVTQDKRLNNKSERTLLSANVRTMLEESDGTLDTREHDNMTCERIRITGSHMVTRFCYTREEEKEMLDVRAGDDSEARMFSPSTREDLVSIKEINKTYARKAFAICDRNITHTAKALGIASNTLRKYIEG